MGLDLQISLGDIVVAASVGGSTYLFFLGLKRLGEVIVAQLSQITARLDTHAKRITTHTRSLAAQGQKIASLEGAVFGRRASDHIPPDSDDGSDEHL